MILPFQRGFVRTSGLNAARFQGEGRGPERKFLDSTINHPIDFTAEVFGNSDGVTSLVGAAQGAGDSQRVGRRIIVRSIQVRGTFLAVPTTSANFSGTVYLYLVQDTQCNGANPATTDIFTGTDMGAAMLNIENTQRFRILKKWVVSFNAMAGVSAAYNNISRHIEWYKRCHMPVQFTATTGATTSVASNNLVLVAGVTPNGADDDITFSGTIRIRYDDI